MRRIILSIILCLSAIAASAQSKEYKATTFGIVTDGITDNTMSIQRAVDFISENGGGTLVFYVGRYVTGAVQLKDNVVIRLASAAVLVAPENYYMYKGAPALVWAEGAKNVGVIGNGVIEGRHKALEAHIKDQQSKGYIPAQVATPELVSFKDCEGVILSEDLKLLEDTAFNPRKK